MKDLPPVYEHLRIEGDEAPCGVYRVVGTTTDEVTLLRVGDGAGRRVYTGEIISVSRGDLHRFDRCPNPDGNRSLPDRVRARVDTAAWSVRVLRREWRHYPIVTVSLVLLLSTGLVGARVSDSPAQIYGGVIVVSSLVLASVGRGRLRRCRRQGSSPSAE